MSLLHIILYGFVTANLSDAIKLPVFVWGSHSYFQPSQDGDLRRVSYQGEDMGALHTAVNSILKGTDALPESMQHMFKRSERPHVTVLFHGSEAHGKPLGKHPQLHATLQAAPASIALPYVHQSKSEDVRSMLLAHAEAASSDGSVLHLMGDCGDDKKVSSSLGDVPRLKQNQRAVILVCPTKAEDSITQMTALEQLSEAVKQTRLSHMFLFMADPGVKAVNSGNVEGSGRSLLARSADSGSAYSADNATAPGQGMVCDKRCRTQVNQLEALILIITIMAALGMGIFCMGILDGPTKFETQKED